MGEPAVKSGFSDKNWPPAQAVQALSAIFYVAIGWLRGKRTKRGAFGLALAFVVALAIAQTAPRARAGSSISVVDDRGVTVAFAQSPRRIVSLLPSLTETVCALGACNRLVGVDRYSNDPPATIDALPKLGGGIDPDIERVLALQPDLVLVATSSRAAARLESLGLKVLALEPRSSANLQRTLHTLGAVLDVRDADQVWREIDAGVAAVAQSLPARVRGARVYFEVSPGPYAAGPGSFVGEIMGRLGVRNIVAPALGAYPKLNPEFVVREDPDVILIGRQNAPRLAERPGWAAMRAIAEQRICAFDQAQADVLVRAGPRMAQAARLIADCLVRMAP